MPRLLTFPLATIIDRLRSLPRGRAGNVAVLFAFSLVPMIGLVGLAVDYGAALSAKSKLSRAADAAAIAAVATAKDYVANNASDPNLTANAIAAGKDRGLRAFAVNAGKLPFASTPVPTLSLTRSANGLTFTSSVTYATTNRNTFGPIFNQPTTAIGGTTGAAADIPNYLDFYLMIDVSASMGLPSTLDGQNYLAANNGGCQFACHFPDQASGYNFAVAKNIQLRSGAVNSAVCKLLTQARTPAVSNQYRVGLYPFITALATLSPLSSNIDTLWAAANCAAANPSTFTTLLDAGITQLMTNSDPSTGIGSGGTHFEAAFSTMPASIATYGDGSSALKPKPFVFLITDGMQNSQYYGERQGSKLYYPGRTPYKPLSYLFYPDSWWLDGTSPAAMSPSVCTALKSNGAIVSILYIPYTTLTVTNQNTWETLTANAAVPQIPTNLQTCATSPSYVHTANTPADIDTALQQMFAQAIQVAHLVK